MAVTGAIIVLTGLSVLSLIISQLHRIIAMIDRIIAMIGKRSDRKSKQLKARSQASVSEPKPELPPLSDLDQTMNRFKPLTKEIGDPFELAALFRIFKLHNDPHPHLTIRSLREQGYLIPAGEGLFAWKHP
jgi:hypothetical protein